MKRRLLHLLVASFETVDTNAGGGTMEFKVQVKAKGELTPPGKRRLLEVALVLIALLAVALFFAR